MTSNLCAHYANESCLSLSTQQYQNLLPLLHVWHDWKHSLSYIRHHPNSQPLRHSILFLPRRQHQGWRFCFIYLISHVQWGGILVPWNTALLVITCNNIKFFFFSSVMDEAQDIEENSLSRTSWLRVLSDTFLLTFRLMERTCTNKFKRNIGISVYHDSN